ncbi:MAG: hypothetical protein INF43_05710 [Alphaproteobacteria bacterium]|nr:hypothetical protein [Alphaproteobacteria bacterium]
MARPSAKRSAATRARVPLVLDFDGTLQRDDLSRLALGWLSRRHPLRAWLVLGLALLRGRPAAKLALEEAAFRYEYRPILRWNHALIAAAKATRQPIVVATGSPERWVATLLAEAGLNWPVLGTTTASGNFIGPVKARALIARYGHGGFDYAGNSRADLAVWAACRRAWVVNARGRLLKRAAQTATIAKVLPA